MAEVFVGALPFRMTKEELKNIFSEFGPIHSIEIFADWVDPKFEPYAIIDLSQPQEAVDKLDGVKVRSNHLRVHQKVKNG